jgi:hypothetical protein
MLGQREKRVKRHRWQIVNASVKTRRQWLVAVLAACGSSKDVDREKAAALYTEVVLDTAPGLSGLAVDDDGVIWTVAERDAKAYLVILDASSRVSKLQPFTVAGIPADTDLEGIAWLGKGKFAFGTESKQDGTATVLLAEERGVGTTIQITSTLEIPEARLGLHVAANHGTEGICGAGTTIVAAIEETGVTNGKRWAPIVRIDHNAIASVHKLWLTTETGKLSGLDCAIGADGSIQVIAIERHFEVTKLLTFSLPLAHDAPITPTVALDLGPVINGKLNLEGIAWTGNGGVIAVVDNQYRGITGPSELLVFKPGVVK